MVFQVEEKQLDNKKPLMRFIAGGFLIVFFFILIWLSYSFELREEKVVKVENLVKQEILNNYLKNNNLKDLQLNIFERENYSILKIEDKNISFSNKVKQYLTAPFLIKQEDCIAKNYNNFGDSIIVNEFNLKELILGYQNLTGQKLIDLAKNDNLKNNFSIQQEQDLLSIFDGNGQAVFEVEDNGYINYYGKVELKNKDLSKFEKSVGYILASFYPETRRMYLPDDTYVSEIYVNSERYLFKEKDGIRFIKNEELGFEFAYRVNGDEVFFANSINGLNKEIASYNKCGNEGAIIASTKYLDNNFKTENYKNIIFVFNNGEVSVVLR